MSVIREGAPDCTGQTTPSICRSSLIRTALLLVTLALTGCNDFFNRPAVIPGGPTLWQNAPSNATFEPPNARPR